MVFADGRQRRDGQPQDNRHKHRLHVSDGLYIYLGGENSPEQHQQPGTQKETGNCGQNPEVTAHNNLLKEKFQITKSQLQLNSKQILNCAFSPLPMYNNVFSNLTLWLPLVKVHS